MVSKTRDRFGTGLRRAGLVLRLGFRKKGGQGWDRFANRCDIIQTI